MIDITDKEKCCGCTACATICPLKCISMIEDEEGFLYPHVDSDKCINCHKCEKICPVLNCKPDKEIPQKAFLARNEDATVRKESTSGGAFSAIANTILEQGGIVFGATFDENFEVSHTYIESVDELRRFRNSKYVQSRIGDSYEQVKDFLDNGRKVCFSGTPCQTEGLYHFLGKDYENLILVDTVCRAVPSPLVWRRYKEYYRPEDEAKLIFASFRDKSQFGYQYSQMCLKFDNGHVRYCGVESDPYLRAFFTNLSDRPSCYDCVFKKRYRVSDLTIWDCFDVYRIDKRFDDNQGVTRILAHSSKGANVIASLKQCTVEEILANNAVAGVKELIESVPKNNRRREFFTDCLNMEINRWLAKWFPDTAKVKAERYVRHLCEKLGIYRPAKRIVRKVIGKE